MKSKCVPGAGSGCWQKPRLCSVRHLRSPSALGLCWKALLPVLRWLAAVSGAFVGLLSVWSVTGEDPDLWCSLIPGVNIIRWLTSHSNGLTTDSQSSCNFLEHFTAGSNTPAWFSLRGWLGDTSTALIPVVSQLLSSPYSHAYSLQSRWPDAQDHDVSPSLLFELFFCYNLSATTLGLC